MPVCVGVVVVAERDAAAIAASVAGASVQSVAWLPRWPFADRGAGGLSPAAVGAFAVPGPASAGAFAAVAGTFGPSSHFLCSGQPGAPQVEVPSGERRLQDGRCFPAGSPLAARRLRDLPRGDSQVGDTVLPPRVHLQLLF